MDRRHKLRHGWFPLPVAPCVPSCFGSRSEHCWDDDCPCGWPAPRIGAEIVRFSELEGVEDDKLTCAGTAKAYNDFMD